MNKGQFLGLLFQTFTKWQKHDATLRAAAITFFTIMPLPSLALIFLAVLAQVYGQQGAMAQLVAQVSSFAGPAVGNLLSELLVDAQSPIVGFLGSFLAIAFALSGALGAFSVLQKSVDIIWEIRAEERGRTAFVEEKILPFALIIGVGAIVISWTAFSTVLFGAIISAIKPVLGGLTVYLIWIIRILLSFGLSALLFAIVFKELPETKVKYRDVWLAAILTAVIFTVLNYFFGLYLSLVQVTTLAGTAGSLIVLFLWIYLADLFLLFGVQFSKVYARAFGSHHNKAPILKWPPRPKVIRVEMKSEVNINIQSQKDPNEK